MATRLPALEREVPMNKGKENMLHFINEVSFVLDDVSLFLDTHPHDKSAMAYYNKYKKIRNEAIREYENIYGPLTRYNVNTPDWTWVSSPWPWEGE